MTKINLNGNQITALAQEITGDIKGYCLDNFERYFIGRMNERRKENRKPLIEVPTEFWKCTEEECKTCSEYYDCYGIDEI